jgi:hypothetical protein
LGRWYRPEYYDGFTEGDHLGGEPSPEITVS